MSNRAPLFIFFSSFLTFLVAFVGLMMMSQQDPSEPGMNRDRTRGARTNTTQAGEAEPAESAAAWLGGRVTQGEEPIGAAEVFLLHCDDGTGAADAAERLIQQVITDESGHFALDPVAEDGDYEWIVKFEGMARAREVRSLVAGEGFDDLDFSLGTGGELVFRVRDARGRALTEASVVVRDPVADEYPALARAELSGFTDSDGLLTLSGADFGRYEAIVTKPGHDIWRESFEFEPDASRSRRSVNATVTSASAFLEGRVVDPAGHSLVNGHVEAIALHVATELSHTSTMDGFGFFRIGPVPDGSYELRVVGDGLSQKGEVYVDTESPDNIVLEVEYGGVASGELLATFPPVGSIELQVSYEDKRGRLVPFASSIRKRVDPRSLQFELEGLPPGRYQVRAIADGFAPGRSATFELVPGGRQDGLEIRLGAGGRLTGKVVGARGEPLEGVRVTAFEGESAPPPAMLGLLGDAGVSQTYTDDEGFFTLDRVSPGRVALSLDAKGWPTRSTAPLFVQEGGELRVGAVHLVNGGSISGRVALSAAGAPLAERLLVRSQDNRTWLLLVPSAAGEYSVQGMPKGTYYVQAFGPDEKPLTAESKLELTDGEHARVDFQK